MQNTSTHTHKNTLKVDRIRRSFRADLLSTTTRGVVDAATHQTTSLRLMPGIPPGHVWPSPGSTVSVSMTQGAAFVSLHLSPLACTFLVQHSSAPPGSFEHPDPPHLPQPTGQHTPEASYPARPLEHDWAAAAWLSKGGGGRNKKSGEWDQSVKVVRLQVGFYLSYDRKTTY